MSKIIEFFTKPFKKNKINKGDEEMANIYKEIENLITNYNKSENKKETLNQIKQKVFELKGTEYGKLRQIRNLLNNKKNKMTTTSEFEKIFNDIYAQIQTLISENEQSQAQQKPTQKQSRVQTNKETQKKTTQLSNCNDDIKEIKKDIREINHKIEFQPKIDLKPIENKISNVEKEVKNIRIPNDYVKKLEFIDKIDETEDELKKSISQISKRFPKIPTDYLKNNDFFASNKELNKKLDSNKELLQDNIKKIKYQTDDIVKELKELKEDSESIPAQIKNLDEKLDKIIDSTSKNSQNDNITKEEKAFVDLADFMRKGVDEFEKVALEYSKNIAKIENLEKLEKEHKETIQKEKEKSFKDGEKQARIDLIKDIFETFPTQFNTIKSMFDEVTEKFKKDEEIEITNENQNEYLPFLNGEIELEKYKILTPAILLNNQVLQKAEVEKIVIEEKTIEKEMPKEEKVEDKNIVENNDKEVADGE